MLDENLPHKLRSALGDRDASTVGYMGWKGRRISIVVLSAKKWTIIKNHLSVIEKAIDTSVSGLFALVDCGVFQRARRKSGGVGI